MRCVLSPEYSMLGLGIWEHHAQSNGVAGWGEESMLVANFSLQRTRSILAVVLSSSILVGCASTQELTQQCFNEGHYGGSTLEHCVIEKQNKQEMLVFGAILLGVAAAAAASGGGGYSPPKQYPCDCPNDLDSLGNRCGDRSAYTRSGGRSPYCP